MIPIWDNPTIKGRWAVKWGRYESEGFTLFISKTRSRAVALIREEGGFKYNKSSCLWENDEKQEWYFIDELEYLP